jgi:hypothetical protein
MYKHKTNKPFIPLVLILILVLLIVGISILNLKFKKPIHSQITENSDNSKLYTNDTYSYTLRFPNSYNFDEIFMLGNTYTGFRLMKGTYTEGNPPFDARVVILIQYQPEKTTKAKNFAVLKEHGKEVNVGNIKGIEVMQSSYVSRRVYLFKNKDAIEFTLNTPGQVSPTLYEQYSRDFDEIINSTNFF